MAVDPELIPEDEDRRLDAVRRYDVLDTPPDGAFDRITALAARHFRVPISIVSIVDTDRIWFKSHHGLEVEEIGRDPGLCASAILQHKPWVVENAAEDSRTLANPLVAGEFGLRFYAGVPLTTSDGHNLGTLCLIDQEPRELTPEETATLEDMAAIVMDELELRLSARMVVDREHALRDHAERMAKSLQASLLPPVLPPLPGIDVAAVYRPADAAQVGGDFYDLFELDSGGWALAIGDVSGKGPSAAAVTALARHTIRTASLSTDDPAQVLALLNRAMFLGRTEGEIEHFCTVHLSFLEPADRGLRLLTAVGGHPPALIARGGGRPERLAASGPAVGWHAGVRFATTRSALGPGDVLLVYTDGFSEARSDDGFLGEEAIASVLERTHGGGGAESVTAALLEMLSAPGVRVRDDAAALVLKLR